MAERRNLLTTEVRHKELEEEYTDHQCKQTEERICYHLRRLLSKEKRNSTLCIALDHAAKKRVLNIFPHKKNQNLDDYLELSPGKHSAIIIVVSVNNLCRCFDKPQDRGTCHLSFQ